MRTFMAPLLVILAVTCACTTGGAPAPDPSGAATPVATATPAGTTTVTPSPAATTAVPSTSAVPSASPRPHASLAAPTATPAAIGCLRNQERNAFVAALLDELRWRDRDAIAARMAHRFQYLVAATDVALDPIAPSVAVKQLYGGVPDPEGNPWFLPLAKGAEVRCVGAVRLADLNADSTFWPGWDVGVLSTGWGEDGKRQAIIVLGHTANGNPVWRGLFYTTTKFELRG